MVRRPVRPEEQKLWALVASTVRPLPGRKVAKPEAMLPPRPPSPVADPPMRLGGPAQVLRPPAPPSWYGPDDIEPGRKRRIVRERDPIGARIDLHGLDQDRAHAALVAFLLRAQAEGHRAVLVITGKGARGDGVLRRRAPEWLAEPMLREVVAGVGEAHRRHGGAGALYVALKRRRVAP
ncbi:MAG: Smr/MutS family protein [Phenylobacterium sp.]|uniref:Smr/MutS family protein n=1 Tax=Phenylobacterium sp. TaxID=1871053 RepID=UPI003919A341